MARLDQLEIVGPDGDITFHDLDPAKGVTNIGRDPENDIIIDRPDVALFLAMIDHREKPYQIMILDEGGHVLLDGQPLQPNLGRDLHEWSTVEIGGYSMVLVEHGGNGTAAAMTSEEKNRALAIGAIGTVLAGAATALQPLGRGVTSALSLQRLALPPADHLDDILIAELSQRESTIECEQTAQYQVTVINGGPIVATFEATIEGLDPAWLIVQPENVNLNEGERAVITIAVTPPRAPTSRAGAHHFAIVITSPNYAGRATRLGATVTINPFFDFAIGDLSPRQNYTGWRKSVRTAAPIINLSNKGNSEAVYRVDGEDDQHGCVFEYQLPDQGSKRSARQAEVHLQPESETDLSIFITPRKRRLLGFRKHNYSLTVTGTPLSGQQMPRSVLGQLQAAPLMGPWILLLLLTLLALLVVVIFRPYITAFAPTGPSDIKGGQSVTLGWNTSPFVRLKLEQEITTSDGAKTTQEVGSVNAPAGTTTLAPLQSVRYRLWANNLLSDLLPFLAVQSEWVPVNVTPVPPNIQVFDTVPDSRKVIVLGESANLIWRVLNADKVTLVGSDGLVQTLSPTDTGSINVSPNGRTNYTLGASNVYGTAEPKQVLIAVVTPTPTPVPKPVISQFDVQPRVITEGQSVNITWEVLGAESVKIIGIPGADKYPPKGNLTQSPTAPGVDYQLIATNGPAGAESTATVGPFHVTVNQAPPPPQPPVIAVFAAVPDSVVQGNNVVLQWEVSGPTTDIVLTGPDFTLHGLAASGSQSVVPDKTSIYILTAVNQTVNAVSSVTVKVTAPVPAPTIDFFTATPTNITQGDQIVLSWTVSGEFTDITVSSTDIPFIPATGLPAVGSLPVKPDRTGTYIITVSYKDAAGQIQRIQRNTAVTVIQLPPPVIQKFTAACETSAPCGLQQTSVTPNTINYNIWSGQSVNLTWLTQNATAWVTLTLAVNNVSLLNITQPNTDGTTSPTPPFPTQPISGTRVDYLLTAYNAANQSVMYRMIFAPSPKPAPPPYGIGGSSPLSTPVTITWKYAPQYLNLVTVGFLIKRFPLGSSTPNATFAAPTSQCTLNTNTNEYDCSATDPNPPVPACGVLYVVVAQYYDINGNITESNSTDPWSLGPCPP